MNVGLQSDRTDKGWLVIFRSFLSFPDLGTRRVELGAAHRSRFLSDPTRSDGTAESIQPTWTSYEAEAPSQAGEFDT